MMKEEDVDGVDSDVPCGSLSLSTHIRSVDKVPSVYFYRVPGQDFLFTDFVWSTRHPLSLTCRTTSSVNGESGSNDAGTCSRPVTRVTVPTQTGCPVVRLWI